MNINIPELQNELAHLIEQRDFIDGRISDIESLITAIERIHGTSGLRVERSAGQARDLDLSQLSQPDAIIALLDFLGRPLDVLQIAANLRVFGYPFRAMTPEGQQNSVSSNLTGLVADGAVVRIARNLYATPWIAAEQTKTPTAVRDSILTELEWTEERLPFVGLKYFRDRVLPGLVEGFESLELRQRALEDLIEDGKIEVFDQPNPAQPDHPTAALRRVR